MSRKLSRYILENKRYLLVKYFIKTIQIVSKLRDSDHFKCGTGKYSKKIQVNTSFSFLWLEKERVIMMSLY